jgi:hypothetical protein
MTPIVPGSLVVIDLGSERNERGEMKKVYTKTGSTQAVVGRRAFVLWEHSRLLEHDIDELTHIDDVEI